jgi:hypothetical protein
VRTRSERLNDLVGAAYEEKYNMPGVVPYTEDLVRKK